MSQRNLLFNVAFAHDGTVETMGPYEFEIRGYEGAKPLRLILTNKATVFRFIGSCATEIDLIDQDIRNFSIPLPPKLTGISPNKIYQIQRVPCKMADAIPPHHDKRNAQTSSCVQTRVRWSRLRRVFVAFAVLLAATKVARPGPIVLMRRGGTGPDPASSLYRRLSRNLVALFLRLRGRSVIELESGYGSASAWILAGVLRRPGEGSLLAWLSADPVVRLESIGALIFPNRATAEADLSSLAGLERHIPPVIFPAEAASDLSRGKSHHSVVAVVPAGATWAAVPSPKGGPLPKISIVIVSFNQAKYLEAAIRSVLDQDYPDLECILVDGGSTDGSIDIIDRYRSRLSHVIVEPDQGQSDALNKGFRLATGEIMNWLCSDDMFEPGSFNRIAETYRRFRPDVIAGGCVRIDEVREAEIRRHHNALLFGRVLPLCFDDMVQFMRSWQKSNYFFQPEVFFSRRAWEISGAFVKSYLYYAMDYDLWLRMAMAGATVMHVPDIIASSRRHSLQKTKDDLVYLHQMRELMKEYLQLMIRISDQIEAPGSWVQAP